MLCRRARPVVSHHLRRGGPHRTTSTTLEPKHSRPSLGRTGRLSKRRGCRCPLSVSSVREGRMELGRTTSLWEPTTAAATGSAGAPQATEHEAHAAHLDCPLHTAMRRIAETAVQQHILHAAGECLPHPNLMQRLSAWSTVHALLRTRICPAMRPASPDPDARAAALHQIRALAPLLRVPDGYPQTDALLQAVARCAACEQAAECPIEPSSEESLL
jgi:hypothetical protein